VLLAYITLRVQRLESAVELQNKYRVLLVDLLRLHPSLIMLDLTDVSLILG